LFPLGGLASFIIPGIICKEKEDGLKPLEFDFDEAPNAATGNQIKPELEMGDGGAKTS